jgi:hypothetical protein
LPIKPFSLLGLQLVPELDYPSFKGGKGRPRSRRRAWKVVAIGLPGGRGYRAAINPPSRVTE